MKSTGYCCRQSNHMTNQQQATVSAGTYAVVTLVTLLFYLIPLLIIMWKLYVKAGKPGWTAIIPVYNDVVMAEIAGMPVWLGWTVGLLAVGSYLIKILSLINLFFGLWLLRGFIMKYDRGIGFWFVVLFLPIIGVFIAKNAHYKGDTNTTPVQGSGPAQPVALQPAANPAPQGANYPGQPEVSAPPAPQYPQTPPQQQPVPQQPVPPQNPPVPPQQPPTNPQV